MTPHLSRDRVAIAKAAIQLQTRFDTSGKTPAHWHHRNEFVRPARDASAAGFFVSIVEIGRRPAHRGLALVETRSWSADKRRRPNHFDWPCTRERAGPRREPLLAPPRSPEGIRFAPKRSRLVSRSAALLFSCLSLGEAMTVCLISLALAGLVAIVVWEAFA
ncbi:hypothetical protein QA645_13795 [Bradyrhizobium sp. CIAT3101]|uniref:hypothetical protein n=1 Tax=Bradyrhizobium sp. CIAT3101 TaxID=439387 RepID=UPI0024B25EC0|nr:hypothetical protein [Bradyrhizobium sp. CIAT3101]WFU83771.1 hypothetical protein QA645_13795 [Bradyrhizobium sp. CIAT3101]